MRAMLIAPEGTALPELGQDVRTRFIHPDGHTNLEFLPPEGTVLILHSPELVSDVSALLEAAASAEAEACAWVPANHDGGPTLATAAAAYSFKARELHLAGGLDSRLSLSEMGMDSMFRLASRAATSLAVPSELVRAVPEFPVTSYLTVFNRNLTSSTQLRYLAPLFLGLIDQPLRDAGVDTSELDLQRSPGNDDVLKLRAPGAAFSGAQTMRTWLDRLPAQGDAKVIISKSRRIPDTHLDGIDAFVEEMWAASGIPAETQSFLREAFADIEPAPQTSLVYAVRAADAEASARLAAVHEAVALPAFRFDPDTGKLEHSNGPADPWTDASEQMGQARKCSVVYLIGVLTREVPWADASPAVVALDVTTTDVSGWLRTDRSAFAHGQQIAGPHALLFNETLRRIDRAVVANDVQRDFLLGAMAAAQRLNMYTYDEDHSLVNLIAIENGTEAAADIITHPRHPFGRIDNSVEFKRNVFDSAIRAERSFSDIVRDTSERATSRLKGALS